MNKILGFAVFCLLLLATALPASADTVQTFDLSQVSGLGVSSASTITIDTTTGKVVSADVFLNGGTLLPFTGLSSTGGVTELAFSTTIVLDAFTTNTITLDLFAPVSSLVGYSGGALCSFNSPCAGGSVASGFREEEDQCIFGCSIVSVSGGEITSAQLIAHVPTPEPSVPYLALPVLAALLFASKKTYPTLRS
jgi:hypothetical protein